MNSTVRLIVAASLFIGCVFAGTWIVSCSGGGGSSGLTLGADGSTAGSDPATTEECDEDAPPAPDGYFRVHLPVLDDVPKNLEEAGVDGKWHSKLPKVWEHHPDAEPSRPNARIGCSQI